METKYIIGIDASNIRHGGGITHLSQLLEHAKPSLSSFCKVIVWSNQNTLSKLPDKTWLVKSTNRLLNGNFLQRTYWQIFKLRRDLTNLNCDILFVPGGSFRVKFKPVITMNQNLLPFETKEIRRFGFSLRALKLFFLRFSQISSFNKSNGLIFLSQYSQDVVTKFINFKELSFMRIPHGVEKRFFKKPRDQYSLEFFSTDNPLKIVYVSSIEFYKHQVNVVQAISKLKKLGYPVELHLYGLGKGKALKVLKKKISSLDPTNSYLKYNSEADFKEIEKIYFNSDISVFASTCETFGQIIIESMAAGLPIACSKLSSMSEILKDGAVYFDPLVSESIKDCLKMLIDSREKRVEISNKAYEYALNYSWEDTSNKTFRFLCEIKQKLELNENINY